MLNFRKKELEDLLLSSEPDLMKEYIETCAAISGLESLGSVHAISSTEFAGYRQAIDAIENYLDKVGRFTDQETITQALLDGGFAPLDKKRRGNITDSFRYHKNRSKRLVEKDGLFGRASWASDPQEIK